MLVNAAIMLGCSVKLCIGLHVAVAPRQSAVVILTVTTGDASMATIELSFVDTGTNQSRLIWETFHYYRLLIVR